MTTKSAPVIEPEDGLRQTCETSPVGDRTMMKIVRDLEGCGEDGFCFKACRSFHACLALYDQVCELSVEKKLHTPKIKEFCLEFAKIRLKSRAPLAVVAVGLGVYGSKSIIITKLMSASVLMSQVFMIRPILIS